MCMYVYAHVYIYIYMCVCVCVCVCVCMCKYICSSIILNYSKLHVLQSICQSIHPHHHYHTVLFRWYLCSILTTHDIY